MVLEAHEKALRGLADFTPREPARAAFEWVQALADVADAAVVKQIRYPNERIMARARDAGSNGLGGYEKALRRMAEYETKIAGATQVELAAWHAKFVTDVNAMYPNAFRSTLST